MALSIFRNRWFERGKRLIDGDQLNTSLGADVSTVSSGVLALGTTGPTAQPVGNPVIVLDAASVNNSGVILVAAYPVGSRVVITNPSANTVIIYPQAGGTIAGGASSNLATTVTTTLLKISATAWIKVS